MRRWIALLGVLISLGAIVFITIAAYRPGRQRELAIEYLERYLQRQ
jgi:ABC-type lipoprotein release transport system permease subunit